VSMVGKIREVCTLQNQGPTSFVAVKLMSLCVCSVGILSIEQCIGRIGVIGVTIMVGFEPGVKERELWMVRVVSQQSEKMW